MAAAEPAPNAPLNPGVDEGRWVVQIRGFLDEDDEDGTGVDPVSISNVPKQLLATKPEAYVPQEVALGPYHYWRPELYQMERYKISAAKRTQKRLKTADFRTLVDEFVKLEPLIRSCYHRYLDYSGETLAWMMAVDASFLLEFIWIFTAKDKKVLERISSRMLHLVDFSGSNSAQNEILRDIMMLENQIPLFLLRNLLRSKSWPTQEEADEQLMRVLKGLCTELSPFKTIHNFRKIQPMERAHLLELLYYVVVPVPEQQQPAAAAEEPHDEDAIVEDAEEEFVDDEGHVRKLVKTAWVHVSSLLAGPAHLLKNALIRFPSIALKKLWWVVIKLPLASLASLPGISFLLKLLMEVFTSPEITQDDEEQEDGGNAANRPPSIEEISIPSVSQLVKMGVKFFPTRGDLSTISFDEKTLTFYLPTVTLDVNTEVILRNLVAFEAGIVSGPLVFTRYTELMNGIIDTEEDVKVLREKGIVSNCLKSDGEVADLWNGMSKSVKLTKVAYLDKVIEDVNRCYSRDWKVRIEKFFKAYVFGSWQLLTFLAVVLLLLLSSLEAFCSVYTCARWLHITIQEDLEQPILSDPLATHWPQIFNCEDVYI
ncbi:hypothetical protein ACLOJK_035893 [Asimina triloba]